MVFALLVMLGGTVITGVAELARARGEGPLSFVIERQAANAESPPAIANEEAETPGRQERDGEKESLLLEVHELFANATLILIILHVVGVIAASIVHKESLVRAMITGFKRADG